MRYPGVNGQWMKVAKCISASRLAKSGEGTLPTEAFCCFQIRPSKNALLVESGHLQILHKQKQLVESGNPPFYCFKAQNAFSNGMQCQSLILARHSAKSPVG